MKKIIGLMLSVLAAGTMAMGGALAVDRDSAAALTKEPAGKAAYLCDCETGTVVYAKNETERLPIASMCKIMTLLLSFEAVERGELSYEEGITVSEHAAAVGAFP